MIRTNIKMRVTPEQSKKVQEICFENGIYWRVEKEIKYLNEPFLFIDEQISFMYEDEEEEFLEEENEEVDADLFIRTNGTCIEEEFTYPMWFKNRREEYIVRFKSLTNGEVIPHKNWNLGYSKYNNFTPHTDTDIWEQVENPFVDEAIKEVPKEDSHNAHYKKQKIDTIARCKANMTLKQQKAICIFNIDKYTHREKGQNLSDIQKVRYYLDWLEDIEIELSK